MFLDKANSRKDDTIVENWYQDFSHVEQTGFKSNDLKKRVLAKYEYYKKAFKLRCKIHNVIWDYRDLHKSLRNFIEGREIILLSYDKVSKMNRKDYVPCISCGTKWLENDQDNCPRCDKMNDIGMFIKLSNYFCVLGDMNTFYDSLDEKTSQILYDNWDYILKFFEKKRRKNYHNTWNFKKREYGIEQYNKIIKVEGGEWGLDPVIKEINKKYNVALIEGTKTIDFSHATNCRTEDFLEDLCRIRFPFCETLIFPQVPIKSVLSLFKPDMRWLKVIIAKGCGIKEANLKAEFFPKLHELNLDDNLISKYDDVKELIKIDSLKIVYINNNPIELIDDIYKLEKLFDRRIDLRYSLLRKYNSKQRIDEESDPDVKRIAKEHIYFDESESEQSNKSHDG